jgi:hypothetical protein
MLTLLDFVDYWCCSFAVFRLAGLMWMPECSCLFLIAQRGTQMFIEAPGHHLYPLLAPAIVSISMCYGVVSSDCIDLGLFRGLGKEKGIYDWYCAHMEHTFAQFCSGSLIR